MTPSMPRKVYVILADTAQLTPAFRALAAEKGATLLHQVTQCYTNASVTTLLTGQQLSDLVPHGTGYYAGRRFHQPCVEADGSVTTGVVWPWRDQNLMRVLRGAGWDIHVHNGSKETWWDLFIDHDPLITHTSTMGPGGFDTPEALATVLRPDPIWEAAERQAIVDMQSARPERPTLYWVVYHDMHSAALHEGDGDRVVAYRSLLQRLRAWNFDEPDSLFWVWSDHGDYGEFHIDGRLRPPNWLTWAMMKDNTPAPSLPRRRLLSITDVRPTLLSRCAPEAPTAAPGAGGGRPLDEAVDENRIYLIEDSRLASDSERCDACAAVMCADWRDGLPRLILQYTYNKNATHGWKFQWAVSEFNGGRPIRHTPVDSFFHDWRLRGLTFTVDPHVALKQALQDRIDWVEKVPDEGPRHRPGLLEVAVRDAVRRCLAVARDGPRAARVAVGATVRRVIKRARPGPKRRTGRQRRP